MDYFAEIVGQERSLTTLRTALETGKINHAYLFAGPAGVGKLTTAEAFGKAIILKSDSQGKAYLKEKAHPDFMIIEKRENKTLIGIEHITREMEPWLALKPYRASHRVVIIKEAHLLSLPAANALLKTLEEPPGHAVIILVADEQNLLETIISRCQQIRFAPIAESDIQGFLIRQEVNEERAVYLARLGQGSIEAAFQLAEEEGLDELWDMARNLIKNLSQGQETEVFKCAEQMEKKPAIVANLLTTMLRDIYIFQATGRQELVVSENNLDFYKGFKKLNPIRVQTAFINIDDLRRLYRGSVNPLLLSINISYQLWDALK